MSLNGIVGSPSSSNSIICFSMSSLLACHGRSRRLWQETIRRSPWNGYSSLSASTFAASLFWSQPTSIQYIGSVLLWQHDWWMEDPIRQQHSRHCFPPSCRLVILWKCRRLWTTVLWTCLCLRSRRDLQLLVEVERHVSTIMTPTHICRQIMSRSNFFADS